jgi:mono/diheme cytochrome c family protein
MRGGCRCFALLNSFFVSLLLACGDDRGTGAPAGSDQITSRVPDTTIVADTSTSSAARGESTPPLSKPAAEAPRTTPPRQTPAPAKPAAPAPKPVAAAPKPAAPTPEPQVPAPSDTPPSTPSSQATDTAPQQTQASAPLRDEYHRAPLDTVSQEVYDGWKQYNLNCARCHGEDVLGTTIAPHLIVSLKPNGPINTKELFVKTVCAGRPEKGMPAWCPLGMEMEKIQAIYAYVKGRSEGKLRPGRPALREG